LKQPYFRQIAWYLVITMFIVGIAPGVQAGIAPSDVINSTINHTQDIDAIRKVIESKLIQERLEKLGYTADEVKSRLEQLNDQQFHQLAQNLDNVKVAGDSGLGIVIALLVIAILVVLLLQLTGHKVIVK
jgi:predicted PurR-regulated permease PerM